MKGRMTKKRVIISIIFICAIIGLVLGVVHVNSLMDKPLGPSLNQAQTPVQNAAQNQSDQTPPLCGQTPILNVLVVGIDYRGGNYLYGLADVIRIVRIDFTNHQVSVLTLDRAIWVEIPGISTQTGITNGMLNQAYFYGVPAMGYYDGSGGGAGLLAETLKKNFDLDINNYAVVNFSTFVKFVDALGGIDVNLPEPVDGTPGTFFNAGEQHLNGTQSLELARIREKYTTLIRDSNQDFIIKGIFDKLSSPDVLTKIPKLIQTFTGAGLTDLSPRQIENMACLLNKMGKTDLTFREIPDKYYVNGWTYDKDLNQNINIWNVDFNIFRSYVSDFMKGQWPQE